MQVNCDNTINNVGPDDNKPETHGSNTNGVSDPHPTKIPTPTTADSIKNQLMAIIMIIPMLMDLAAKVLMLIMTPVAIMLHQKAVLMVLMTMIFATMMIVMETIMTMTKMAMMMDTMLTTMMVIFMTIRLMIVMVLVVTLPKMTVTKIRIIRT